MLFQNGLLSAVPFVCMCVTGIGSGQLADWMRENNVLSTGEVRKVLATGGECLQDPHTNSPD